MYGPRSYYTPGNSYPRTQLRATYPGYFPAVKGTLPNHSNGFNAGLFDVADIGEGFEAGVGVDAIIITTKTQPEAHKGEQWIYVQVWEPASGDKFYIYPCCKAADQLGPVEIEYHCTTAPALWTVTINGKETGNYIANVTNPGPGIYWTTLYACADHKSEMVKAKVDSTGYDYVWDDDLDPGDGKHAGLGHDNGAGGAQFDDFAFGELRSGTGASEIECSDCFCWCLDTAIGKILHLTVINGIDRVACANGTTAHMFYDWTGTMGRWEGMLSVRQADGVGYQSINWCLECSGTDDDDRDNPGANFTLYQCIAGGCGNSWPAGPTTPWTPIPELSSCEPLTLVFGPFEFRDDEMTCFMCYDPDPMHTDPYPNTGQFYLVLTE